MSDSSEIVTLLSRDRFDPTPLPSVEFVLTVLSGADRGASITVTGLEPSELLVGQSEVASLRLGDAEISRRHVGLELTGNALRVRDLDSTNGSWVNGVRVKEALLEGGETLKLGNTTLAVERRTSSGAASLPMSAAFGRLVGASTEMRRLHPLLERLAASDLPVLIEGETGTGKELLAESLHEAGARAERPFIVFDCTAVPAGLMESELFGHERGAFTGADRNRTGVFELAHRGTLFIDEIGELDSALQPKLLRVLERQEFRRVGGRDPLKVDVRVIAATHRDLDAEVAARRFREDLLHRLAVARVELPPLRRRRGDVSLLARAFWRNLGGDQRSLPSELLADWESRSWPGNVRQLRNAVAKRHALGALGDFDTGARSAPEGASSDLIDEILAMRLPLSRAREMLVEAFERKYVQRVLDEHGGNVGRAASAAGLARRYFQLLKAKRGPER
ncbi:MAG: sigma 54-interacting transcriptional regulator [Polyangiaceae bacterium]